MSVMKLESILCDHGEDCEADPPWVSAVVRYTRREAARGGWTMRDGLDYCPEHSKEAPDDPR